MQRHPPGGRLSTAIRAPAATGQEHLSLAPQRMLPGHRIHWLFGGARAYPAMLDAIAMARTEILLETYIWASDANGRRFVDAVCIKAQEGVRVRCVIDGAGSFGFSGDDVARMRSAGVMLSVFHPVGPGAFLGTAPLSPTIVGMTRQASCSCEQLRLSAEGEPVRISVCHCLACQRRTGSAFGFQARFEAGWVRLRELGGRLWS